MEAACRAGKPLLVEKPLATSLVEARHITSMLSASGVRAMVAHTLRFNRTVQTVQARPRAPLTLGGRDTGPCTAGHVEEEWALLCTAGVCTDADT